MIIDMKYDHFTIEEKWKKIFSLKKPFAFKKDPQKKKYYCLEMYPYPSGNLHVGHIRNYSIGDVIARHKILEGYDVLHPIGWDAFGLPAENAAIQNKTHPAKWTFSNIATMRKQLQDFGFSYDYDNEVCTAKSDYYKWGQWFFLKLYEMGLVYRKKALVNWDPVDKTVLAKEQVHDGKAWRSGAVVEKKEIEQWYIKISHYAEELLNDLDNLPEWPEKVKIMQRNWIGKSEGVLVNFKFQEEIFPIFTTRADTLFATSFMAIAFDHQDLEKYVNSNNHELLEKVRAFRKKCQEINQDSNYTKEGIFLETYIENPLNQEKIPLYVANFVLAEYGTGAIMGCPAHDQRDFDFAKKHSLPIKVVIQGEKNPIKAGEMENSYEGEGVLVNSGKYNGLPNQEAKEVIANYLEKNNLGKKIVNFKFKDWLISRQRYWGNPIPMLYDENGNYQGEDFANLPVTLPEDVAFTEGGNPLATSSSFKEVIREENSQQKIFYRETDTMDTFTCSSWYFLRYVDSKNNNLPFTKEAADYYLPVDHYIGGIEHACMHLLYARFFHKAIRDMGLISTNEPFKKLTTQGMVIAPSYFSAKLGKYFHPSELADDKKLCPKTGEPLIIKKEKMSKSKKNGVILEDILKKYGADSLRLFVLFAAPVEKDLEWNEKGIEGSHRFLQRVLKWANKIKNLQVNPKVEEEPKIKDLQYEINQLIYKVDTDINRLHFNTAIAHLMTFINGVGDFTFTSINGAKELREAIKTFLILLSPFAPFIGEELFEDLNLNQADQNRLVAEQKWPKHDASLLQAKKATIVIQVNGKLRGKLSTSGDEDKNTIIRLAKEEKSVKKHLGKKTIVKEIYVPQKLINLVVK